VNQDQVGRNTYEYFEQDFWTDKRTIDGQETAFPARENIGSLNLRGLGSPARPFSASGSGYLQA